MSDEMKEDLAARNAAAEKAMGDAIRVLEGAIELGAGLSEEKRRELYAVKFRDVLGLLHAVQSKTWPRTERVFVSLPDAYAQKSVAQGLVCGISVKPDEDDEPCDKFHRRFVGELFCNGERIFTMYARAGKEKSRKMCLRAMDAYINHRAKRRRHLERKSAAQEAK